MISLQSKQLVLFETKECIDYYTFYYDIICVINDFDKFETLLQGVIYYAIQKTTQR